MKMYFLFCAFLISVVSCNQPSTSQKAEQLVENAKDAIEKKDFPSAISSAKNALDSYAQIGDTLGMIESNYLMARSSALSGEFADARKYGEEGSRLCKTFENFPLEYKINNILSWSYFELGKGFAESIAHNERQLYVVRQLNDDSAKATVYNNYGYDATVSGQVPLENAINYVQFANDYYANAEESNGRWYTLMNLNWQYRLLGDLNASEEYGRLAVLQAEKDNDRHAIIETIANLGETLLEQGKIAEARVFYERGLEQSLVENDRDKYVFDVYYSRYLWQTDQRKEAINLLEQAVSFLEKSEVFYEMMARAFLANYYHELGETSKAKEQIMVFKNPRANYYSQESEVIALEAEAQIVAEKDEETALTLIENKLSELDISGARILQDKLNKIKERILN